MRCEHSAQARPHPTDPQHTRSLQQQCASISNKGFTNQSTLFLSPLFSHACAHLRPQPLCFDMLHKNTQGEGLLHRQHFPPESELSTLSFQSTKRAPLRPLGLTGYRNSWMISLAAFRSGSTRQSISRVRAVAAQEQAFDRRLVARPIQHRPHREDLVQRQFAVKMCPPVKP